VFEVRLLRRIFGLKTAVVTGEWRKLHIMRHSFVTSVDHCKHICAFRTCKCDLEEWNTAYVCNGDGNCTAMCNKEEKY
jgi:hypothetical protein